MSRWTPKSRGSRDGDEGRGDQRRAHQRGAGRDSRRDDDSWRTPGDRDRSGGARGNQPRDPRQPGDRIHDDRLREPRSTDRYVRGRSRLTVRELMEQMNAAESAQAVTGDGGPGRPADSGRAATRPDGRRAAPDDDNAPTQIIPTTPAGPEPQAPKAAAPTPPADRPTPPNRPEPPAETADGPPADDRPTEVHRFGNDVTQKITPVAGGGSAPGVDLSDAATQKRVTEESRGQDSHAAPFQPTPDLSGAIPVVRDTADAGPAPSGTGGGGGRGDGPPDGPGAGGADSGGSDAAPAPRPFGAPRPRPHRVRGRSSPRSALTHNATVTGRILVAVACVLALVGTGFVWGYMHSVNGSWKTITAVNPDDENIRNKNAQYGDENYLIVGTDTRSGQNSRVGAGTTADAEGARSDTIILVNIPANRSRVVAVSFPRDLQVDRPDCQQWDNNNGAYTTPLPAANAVKLNSVYADGGPECLVRVLTQMSGLNINHFIAMDFVGFEKVVSAVGGVEVCSTTPLYDYELGQILRKPGKQKLTGRRALNYVRARMVSTEGNGDYGRIKRQQLFMSSLLRSTLSGNVLANPNKLNQIVKTFIDYSFVDKVDTQSLLNLAESMQDIEAGRVSFVTVPTSGTSTDGSNNEIPRTEDINAIFNAIIDDRPLPGEEAKGSTSSSSSTSNRATSSTTASTPQAPPTKVSATAQNPGNVGLRILNGTGRAGEATDISDRLTPEGFDVRGVADASENRTDTVIRYGPGEQDSAATLAEVFPGASIQLDNTVRSGVEVILGSSFGGELGTAPAAGSTLSVDQLPEAKNNSNLPNDLAVTNAGDATCS